MEQELHNTQSLIDLIGEYLLVSDPKHLEEIANLVLPDQVEFLGNDTFSLG